MSISLPYGAIASAQNGIKMLIHAEISSQSGWRKDKRKPSMHFSWYNS